MGDNVKDQVILFSVLGEVFAGVIDDLVRAQRAQKIQLAGVIHRGYLRPVEFRKLHGKHAGAAAGAINQHPVARLNLPLVANPLQGDDGRLGNGRGLLEGQPGWFERHGCTPNADILGKPIAIAHGFAKDFITRLKRLVVSANRFNLAGDVRAEYRAARFAKPSQAGIQRFPGQSLPVRPIDGCRVDFDQHFVVFGRGLLYLGELENLRRTILVIHNCFHLGPLPDTCHPFALSVCRRISSVTRSIFSARRGPGEFVHLHLDVRPVQSGLSIAVIRHSDNNFSSGVPFSKIPERFRDLA
jgi:hypothetical protein